LHEVAARQPDAILMDIVMPGANGWEVVGSLRANGVTAAPIIIVSADAFHSEPQKRNLIGGDDFILKPVLAAELLAKLEQHMRLDWIYREHSAADDGDIAPAPLALAFPPPEDIKSLAELGALGYVKGIIEKLDQIEQRYPERYTAFAGRLRAAAKRFRLDDYARLVNEAMQHATEPS
jgi:hypothetical protein